MWLVDDEAEGAGGRFNWQAASMEARAHLTVRTLHCPAPPPPPQDAQVATLKEAAEGDASLRRQLEQEKAAAQVRAAGVGAAHMGGS